MFAHPEYDLAGYDSDDLFAACIAEADEAPARSAGDMAMAPRKTQLCELLRSRGWTESEISDCDSDTLLDLADAFAAIDTSKSETDLDEQPSPPSVPRKRGSRKQKGRGGP